MVETHGLYSHKLLLGLIISPFSWGYILYIYIYIRWVVSNIFYFSIQLGISSSQLTFTHIFQDG